MASSRNFESEPTRVAGGHKAALKNPNVSEEAKERSQAVLDDLESSGEPQRYADERDSSKDETRVNAGYKATMKNPNVSSEAKQHAKEVLEDKGAI
ncbi:hypothetical protein JAAARDRAFT_583445 [Jaapia argillacea MUCL 33604]|uniref:Conidiation protein 6 n=1 Tax=Jaapia argillacea MUCL 33604 TaxID=933084 RepID=A0A067P9A2_9AGAM|nr:hypothetical protein JAAARDRAFT_583445 [Jaapia argillacea MUCL 33604]